MNRFRSSSLSWSLLRNARDHQQRNRVGDILFWIVFGWNCNNHKCGAGWKKDEIGMRHFVGPSIGDVQCERNTLVNLAA